jgi:hypothetical protein
MYHVPTLTRSVARQLLWWWGASLVGGGIAGGLLFVGIWWRPDVDLILLADVGWILGATCVGVGQSLVFPSKQFSRPRWIGVSLFGASLVVGAARVVRWMTQTDRSSDGSVRHILVSSGIAMLVLGICQAAFLRRHYRRTGWWIAAAGLGGISTPLIDIYLMPVLLPAEVTSAGQELLLWAFQLGVRWLSLTVWMGIVLVALLRRRDDAAVRSSGDPLTTTAQE